MRSQREWSQAIIEIVASVATMFAEIALSSVSTSAAIIWKPAVIKIAQVFL